MNLDRVHERDHNHNHAGKHSELRRIESSNQQIQEYLIYEARQERTYANELGEEAQLSAIRAELATYGERATQPGEPA